VDLAWTRDCIVVSVPTASSSSRPLHTRLHHTKPFTRSRLNPRTHHLYRCDRCLIAPVPWLHSEIDSHTIQPSIRRTAPSRSVQLITSQLGRIQHLNNQAKLHRIDCLTATKSHRSFLKPMSRDAAFSLHGARTSTSSADLSEELCHGVLSARRSMREFEHAACSGVF